MKKINGVKHSAYKILNKLRLIMVFNYYFKKIPLKLVQDCFGWVFKIKSYFTRFKAKII